MENPLIYSSDHRSPQAVEQQFLSDFPMRAYNAGRALYRFGKHQHAIMAFKHGLVHDPTEFRLHMMLAITYTTLDRPREAGYQRKLLSRINLSPELARHVEEAMASWNHIPPSTEELPIVTRNPEPHLTHSLLGIDGGFGNQVFQFGVAKLYAEKYGMHYQASDWIGRRIFGLDHALISQVLPYILEVEFYRDDLFPVSPYEAGLCDRDCQGYFQQNTGTYAAYQERFRDYFKPVSAIQWILNPFLGEVRKKGETLVAIHVRRGDAKDQGRMVASKLYLDWLKGVWPTLAKPVLFLASDDMENVRKEFADFNPVTAEGLHFPIQGAEFYPDFFMLTQADILAAANSTFSFAASMLNRNAKTFVRPNQEGTRLEAFDPWGSHPTL